MVEDQLHLEAILRDGEKPQRDNLLAVLGQIKSHSSLVKIDASIERGINLGISRGGEDPSPQEKRQYPDQKFFHSTKLKTSLLRVTLILLPSLNRPEMISSDRSRLSA